MGLSDCEIIEEIGDLYVKEGIIDLATKAYQELVRVSPKHGEGYHKLGDVYVNNQNSLKERSRAIDSYKQAIDLIEGESNKAKIALTL